MCHQRFRNYRRAKLRTAVFGRVRCVGRSVAAIGAYFQRSNFTFCRYGGNLLRSVEIHEVKRGDFPICSSTGIGDNR